MKALSRVVWSEGMHLAQQHFQVQNSYFELLAATALRTLFPTGYGVASCLLDDDALLNGTVNITAGMGIMPDGLPFAFPDEPAPKPLAVGEIFSPTQSAHTLLLAVPEETPGRANCVLPGQTDGVAMRFTAEQRPVPDENTGFDARPVNFARKNFRFLIDSEPHEGLITMPIARIQRDGAGHFVYDPGFIGPSLRIGASRRLRELVARLVDALEASTSAIVAERAASAGQAEYSAREISGFWYVHAIHTATPILRHWLTTGDAHPEELYLRLAQLAGALCTFSLHAHPRDLPAYDHDAPERCFADLDRHIRRHLDVYRPSNAVTLPIRPMGESLFSATVSDARCFAPGAHWFLGVRAKAPAAEIVARTGKLVKICSAKVIARLVKEAYPGMAIEHVPVPPADLSPRIGTQYFAVQRTDPCWKSIVDSSEVGLYIPAALPEPELELKVILEQR